MIDIAKIDKNFFSANAIDEANTVFHNVKDGRFDLYGVFYENGCYRRLPESIGIRVNEGIQTLHTHTAGGRLRFITDSPFIVLSAKLTNLSKMEHMTLVGSCGFDLYIDNIYSQSFRPHFSVGADGYTLCARLSGQKHDVTINFPTYSSVTDLCIGLHKDAVLEKAPTYKIEKPVVYYGSSITQGGCCSRPGMTYQAQIHRQIDADYINLGFSGSAHAEAIMADYINTLPMSAFVYDYDHNAPNADELLKTHEPFFQKIREKQPDLPIVIVSAPTHLRGGWTHRRDIVYKTYENAVKAGDKNVYFVDGQAIFEGSHDCTVDNCHPTDLGFYFMAQKIGDAVKEALNV